MSKPDGQSDPESETIAKASRRQRAEEETLANPPAKSRRLARRHPDIEIARLLVKRGLVKKAQAVEALKIQKARAKQGRTRVPFLRQLVKRGALDEDKVDEAQDEIRRNTYLCDRCNARAVILAGSQSRAGACPRCGHEISVDAPSDPAAVPVREFADQATDLMSTGARDWRPMTGSRYRRALPLGELAFERYLVQAELGRGAMGVVYRAQHMQLDKPVALKVLFPDEDQWQHQVARFRREAAAVQKLKHHGIVGIHDFGGDGEVYYLTMDLVPGGKSLHTALKDFNDPPALRWRLEVLVEVARAAAHAHEHGVIHRDLKPANVLLHPDGHALVADFGLAKDEEATTGELTRTHDRLGTPLFMAPEQIRKGASTVDLKADVWALGVMLFVCVTGRYPFRSRTVMDLYLRILREAPDWYGDKYSAPDAIRPVSEDTGESKFPSSVSGSDVDLSDTEISAHRNSDGELPKTLADPRAGIKVVTPAPFSKAPELEGKTIPSDLKAIISCALAKDPEDRYPSAIAFADDVERFLRGERVHGGGPTVFKRMRQQLWRRRVLRPLALGLAILAGVIGLFGYLAHQKQKAELELDRQVEAAWAQAAGGGEQGHVIAEGALTALLTNAPEHPRALLRRGTARTRLLRFEDARADLERAEALAGDAASDPVGLSIEVGAARARLELLAGQPRPALTFAQQALDVPANRRPPLTLQHLVRTLAVAALTIGEPDALAQAEIQVGRLCAQPDASPELHALHGRLALARADTDAARARLGQAEKPLGGPQDDEHLDVSLLRGALLLAEKEPAKDAFRKVTGSSYPNRSDREVRFFYPLALQHMQNKRWEENVRINAIIARLVPWVWKPDWFRAKAYLNNLSDGEKALDALRAAVSKNPYDLGARDAYLALLLVRPDQAAHLDEALEHLRREEDVIKRGSPSPALEQAYVHARRGQWTRAWKALDRSDELVPSHAHKRGLRSHLLRAAIVSLAPPEDLKQLKALPTWQDRTQADWEQGYNAPYDEMRVSDALEVARIYLEAKQPSKALDMLDGVTALARRQRRPQGRRMQGALLVFKARALAALSKPRPAVGKLRDATRGSDLAPSALPESLRWFPELKDLAEDDGFKAVLASFEKRREM